MGGGSSGPGNPGGRGGQKIMPSVGGVWIFSGITHCYIKINYLKPIKCLYKMLCNFRLTLSLPGVINM